MSTLYTVTIYLECGVDTKIMFTIEFAIFNDRIVIYYNHIHIFISNKAHWISNKYILQTEVAHDLLWLMATVK